MENPHIGGGSLRASVDDMDFDELFNASNGNSPQHPSSRARALDEVRTIKVPLCRRRQKIMPQQPSFKSPAASLRGFPSDPPPSPSPLPLLPFSSATVCLPSFSITGCTGGG